MPKSGTSARTRPYKRSTKRKRGFSSYSKQPVGPRTVIRKLRYVTRITIAPGVGGAAGNHFFKANGMFDPDSTGVGHQPLGFDQYMSMYDHFKVLKSKCTISSVTGNTDANGNSIIYALSLDDDATTNTNIENMIEQGLTAYSIQNSGASSYHTQLVKSFDLKLFNNSQQNASTVIGDIASDPFDTAFYNVSVASLSPSATPLATCIFLVVIDYTAAFTERKTLISS